MLTKIIRFETNTVHDKEEDKQEKIWKITLNKEKENVSNQRKERNPKWTNWRILDLEDVTWNSFE